MMVDGVNGEYSRQVKLRFVRGGADLDKTANFDKILHVLDIHTDSRSNVSHSTLPVFASGSLDFQFRDYLWLVVICIVHTCA